MSGTSASVFLLNHESFTLGLAFVLSLLLALVLVPFVQRKALQAQLVDLPDDHRKLHAAAVPRLGGVAIFLAFLCALGLMQLHGENPLPAEGITGMLAGGSIIFVLGLLDDLFNLSAGVKLLGQCIAAIVAFSLGVSVNVLDLPFSQLLPLGLFSFPVTLLWLVGLPNAMNFIDGVDGLASGVSIIASLTLMMIASFTHQPEAALLAALLAGSTLGFWVFNANPARLFMGDSGALFLGFVLASISVLGALKTTAVVMLTPVVILSVPLLDITYATSRRLLKGQNPMKADAEHLHHRFIRAGWSPWRTSGFFYALCLLSGCIVAYYVYSLLPYALLMLTVVILSGLLLFIFRRREILTVRKNALT